MKKGFLVALLVGFLAVGGGLYYSLADQPDVTASGSDESSTSATTLPGNLSESVGETVAEPESKLAPSTTLPPVDVGGEPKEAPVIEAPADEVVGDGERYTVVLKATPQEANASSLQQEVIESAKAEGGTIVFEMNASLVGFIADLSDDAVETLRSNEHVSYIEEDRKVDLLASQVDSSNGDLEELKPLAAEDVPQAQAKTSSWGLDRLDQRQGLDGSFALEHRGQGTNIYIMDTGIRASHREFGGRVRSGQNFVEGDDTSALEDCGGHGVGVASAAAGETVGVANQANLHSLKIFPCVGNATWTDIGKAWEWVAVNAETRSVVNMSFGARYNSSYVARDIINNMVSANIVPVMAAGNHSKDACYGMRLATRALIVGATDSADKQTFFSSFGSCVDLYAPGQGVTLASNSSDNAYASANGTSFSSPYTAGVAASYWSERPELSAEQVIADVIASATPGEGSVNKILYADVGGNSSDDGESIAVEHALTAQSGSMISYNGNVQCPASSADYALKIYDVATGQLATDGVLSGSVDCGSSIDYDVPVIGARYQAQLTLTVADKNYVYTSKVLDTSSAPEGTAIVVRAKGDTGEEILELEINGSVVHTWTAATQYQNLTYTFPGDVSSMKVSFVNDHHSTVDRNVTIDYARVDSQQIESETTRSNGVWVDGDCGVGYKQLERISCNGWFEYLPAS